MNINLEEVLTKLGLGAPGEVHYIGGSDVLPPPLKGEAEQNALEALERPCEVELYSDSQYLVNAFNEHWIDGWIMADFRRGKKNEVKNIDLWERLLDAKAPHNVTFIWVKGHDGHPENERCDRLATSAADGEDLTVDEGYPGAIDNGEDN